MIIALTAEQMGPLETEAELIGGPGKAAVIMHSVSKGLLGQTRMHNPCCFSYEHTYIGGELIGFSVLSCGVEQGNTHTTV